MFLWPPCVADADVRFFPLCFFSFFLLLSASDPRNVVGFFKCVNGNLLAPPSSTRLAKSAWFSALFQCGGVHIMSYLLNASTYLHAGCTSRTANEYSISIRRTYTLAKNKIAARWKVSQKIWNFAFLPNYSTFSAGRRQVKYDVLQSWNGSWSNINRFGYRLPQKLGIGLNSNIYFCYYRWSLHWIRNST